MAKKTKKYQFPFIRFHGRFYPLIPITLKRKKYQVHTFALLDSGASISVFRPEIAKALKISKSSLANIHLGTASGDVRIRLTRVTMALEEVQFKTKIGFSESFAASFNILGREGFFNRFNIGFYEKKRMVEICPLKGV